MQDQLFGDHGRPRVYRSKQKSDSAALMQRYNSEPEVRQRMQANARRRHFLKKYGITEVDYDRMMKEQSGVCAVCGGGPSSKTEGSEPRLYVDHCHVSGEVRALLCRGCNSALGMAKDDPERLRALALYVESFKHKDPAIR